MRDLSISFYLPLHHLLHKDHLPIFLGVFGDGGIRYQTLCNKLDENLVTQHNISLCSQILWVKISGSWAVLFSGLPRGCSEISAGATVP